MELNDASDSPRRSIHEAIDDLFDAELNDEQARDLVRRADAHACEDIVKTERMISMLKRPIGAPDLTDAILSQVEDEREFIDTAWRRFVRVGRVAVAACLLLTLFGVALAQRYWPEATTLRTDARPVSVLLQTTEREATDGVRAIDTTLDTFGRIAVDVSEVVQESRRGPAKLPAPERVVVARVSPGVADVRFDTSLASGVTVGAGRPPFTVYAYSPAPTPNDAPTEMAALLSYSTATTANPELSGVWSVDVAKLTRLRSHTVKPQIRGIDIQQATFRELP
jgi:hypothetical protein